MMLLQVMTEDNNSGWTSPGAGLRPIVDVGGPPIVVRNVAGTVALSRPDAASLEVVPLDINGYRSDAQPVLHPGDRFRLLPRTLHYLIRRAAADRN